MDLELQIEQEFTARLKQAVLAERDRIMAERGLKYELEQVAAVCVSWRECLERKKETETPESEEQ